MPYPERLKALRTALSHDHLSGFIVPRADRYQGEYVAPCDERLAWLTAFSGSAGYAVVLPDHAAVLTDGRYQIQVKAQIDAGLYQAVNWPQTSLAAWIKAHIASGDIGFDPWLHTIDEIAKMQAELGNTSIRLTPCTNKIDAIWHDRPSAPMGRVVIYPDHLAGKSHAQKRADLAQILQQAGHAQTIITLPDGICWLLNIRGSDVTHNPVLQAMALVNDQGHVTLFADTAKFDATVLAHLGPDVTLCPPSQMIEKLAACTGTTRLDPVFTPYAIAQCLKGHMLAHADDPCRLPKACKNAAELAATRGAHLRDGAAVVRFLAWLDRHPARTTLTELDLVQRLEECRRDTGLLHDLSFDTICGAGPNGAIIHYRVTPETNRQIGRDDVILLDSGAQYQDGTTDITRTMAYGVIDAEIARCYTRVLQGLIAISRVRFPKGLAGRDLDALARMPLWLAGQDYDHGTGHGVGVFLSVHEGPQRLSRLSDVPLAQGMILSNEPGYYREGAFGIRLENLIIVQNAPDLGDNRAHYCFETLTHAPFDRRLIVQDMLSQDERRWVNAYHQDVLAKIGPLLDDDSRAWLAGACTDL